MGIESRHAYRFGYLKSEKWQNVRLEALVKAHGKCAICGENSSSNDAHHMWYPDNIYDTTACHLVVLCRPCHEFVHLMLPECKTKDEKFGRDQWLSFMNAVVTWRLKKQDEFAAKSRLIKHNHKPKCRRLALENWPLPLAELPESPLTHTANQSTPAHNEQVFL